MSAPRNKPFNPVPWELYDDGKDLIPAGFARVIERTHYSGGKVARFDDHIEIEPGKWRAPIFTEEANTAGKARAHANASYALEACNEYPRLLQERDELLKFVRWFRQADWNDKTTRALKDRAIEILREFDR